MERFAGTIDELRDVDVAEFVLWLEESPPHEWRGEIGWRNWPDKFRPLAEYLVDEHYPGCQVGGMGLWIVEPGQVHPSHIDEQGEDWLVRIHVPLATNMGCLTAMEGEVHCLMVGKAYRFNTLAPHLVVNHGNTRRVHFMFDVMRGKNGATTRSGGKPYQEAQDAGTA